MDGNRDQRYKNTTRQGLIVLMGSGELTGTMVEVHKNLLRRYGRSAQAVFLDTPAGFQLNVEQISAKASDYFNTRLQHPLKPASFKSADPADNAVAGQAFLTLSQADYILIGPGSPTYALRQWQQSPIPKMLVEHITGGGCLVASSAAALTIGRFTLPVYEIYKVGQELHWVDGLDILNLFGMDWVVVPHWNNAEGGNHDTRFCFMGALRFKQLEAMLPRETGILGLDEHTALIIDLEMQSASIQGVGRVTIRRNGCEQVFAKGENLSLKLLRGDPQAGPSQPPAGSAPQETIAETRTDPDASLWRRLHALEHAFKVDLEAGESLRAAGALLDFERLLWQEQDLLQERESLGAAREILREMLVLMANQLDCRPILAPLIDDLLSVRATLRERRQWQAADALRDSLQKAGVVVEDTQDGAKWYVRE